MDGVGRAVARNELPERYESGDAGHRREEHERQGHRQRSFVRRMRGMEFAVFGAPEDAV